ncbi:MAG TPA: choice-of-anchor tandem repeat GloVer-containing protein [Candidatus Tumulicola sp.]|jgi:uncharacterized repeat protein (TIGR03803 family)
MTRLRTLVGIVLSATILTACGGSGGALNPATNTVAAQTASHRASSSGYQQLYAFKGTPDGASPLAGLIAVKGKLYGTTLNGSKNYCSASCNNGCYLGCGTVYSVNESGREDVVYNFRGNLNSAEDGSWPFGPVTNVKGVMYGVTSSNGANSAGMIFSVTPSGKETNLYSFKGSTDAQGPEGGLTYDGGELYGTTVYGGGSGCGGAGCGTVYETTTAGAERVIYSFKGGTDGERDYSNVVALHGKLYGTTLFGGSGCGSTGCGTVYELTKNGKKKTLHTFAGTADGAYPNGLIAVKGVLYGTTEGGGPKNSGVIFSITTKGTENALYAFTDIPDGNQPDADLLYYNGKLYGTTNGGGTGGFGTVFEEPISGGSDTVLYSFAGGSDGSGPQSPVVDFQGELYGTTYLGGGTGCSGSGCGTIFKVSP